MIESVDVLWTLPRAEARRRTWGHVAAALERVRDEDEITTGAIEDLQTAAAWVAELGLAHFAEDLEQKELDEAGDLCQVMAADLTVDGWLDGDQIDRLHAVVARARERADAAAVVVP